MAAVGGFVNAGELLAQAGEAEMQAGNFPLSTGNSAITERPDLSIGQGAFRIIYRATADVQEGADVSQAVGTSVRSTLDIEPRGDVPQGQMRDVWLFQTNDDGQVYAQDGDLVRTDGLETAVYLSLFGGNVADDGSEGNRLAWWGNSITDSPSQNMTSRYQNFIDGAAISSGNLLRANDAAAQDLAWLDELGAEATISAQAVSRDKIHVNVGISGQNLTF